MQDFNTDIILCCCDEFCEENDPPLEFPNNGACCSDFFSYCPALFSIESHEDNSTAVYAQESPQNLELPALPGFNQSQV